MATLKYSRQRESIKEFLMTRTDHPTADIVYHQLRKMYPNISLGTVYRNLSLLADIVEINRVSTGDGADHYDGHTAPHYHVICKKCHKITDLDMDYLDDVETIASQHYNGRIEKHVINFYGICEECSALEEKTS